MPSLSPPPWRASARLRLREFVDDDVQDIANMHYDPRVRALLIDSRDDVPLHEADMAHGFVQSMHDFYREHEGTGIWCAERAEPPDPECVEEARIACAEGDISPATLARVQSPAWHFVGWFSLVHLADASDALEIGARLRPDVWGSTLSLDGGEWLLMRAFEELGYTRVFGHCHPTNRSAAHCLHVLGFSTMGHVPYNGQKATQFTLERVHWADWHHLPRRERLRHVRKQRQAG